MCASRNRWRLSIYCVVEILPVLAVDRHDALPRKVAPNERSHRTVDGNGSASSTTGWESGSELWERRRSRFPPASPEPIRSSTTPCATRRWSGKAVSRTSTNLPRGPAVFPSTMRMRLDGGSGRTGGRTSGFSKSPTPLPGEVEHIADRARSVRASRLCARRAFLGRAPCAVMAPCIQLPPNEEVGAVRHQHEAEALGADLMRPGTVRDSKGEDSRRGTRRSALPLEAFQRSRNASRHSESGFWRARGTRGLGTLGGGARRRFRVRAGKRASVSSVAGSPGSGRQDRRRPTAAAITPRTPLPSSPSCTPRPRRGRRSPRGARPRVTSARGRREPPARARSPADGKTRSPSPVPTVPPGRARGGARAPGVRRAGIRAATFRTARRGRLRASNHDEYCRITELPSTAAALEAMPAGDAPKPLGHR